MKQLNQQEINFIIEFVNEIMAIYDADEEGILPIKIEDMSKTIYEILNAEQ